MSTVTAQVTLSANAFPAGTVISSIQCKLMSGATLVQTVSADGTGKATFLSVAPGSYTVVSQALDGSNNPLGSAVTSAPITVAAPNVTLNTPTAVSLAVS